MKIEICTLGRIVKKCIFVHSRQGTLLVNYESIGTEQNGTDFSHSNAKSFSLQSIITELLKKERRE